jgi:hypothetical protein
LELLGVLKVYVGRGKPTRKHLQGKHQWADGIMHNMRVGDGRSTGFDTAITNGIGASIVDSAARREHAATHNRERTKINEKEFACKHRNIRFLPVVLDSFSKLGERAADVIIKGYTAMLEATKTDQEKWEILNLKKRGLATLSVAVQRRNAAIIFHAADPISGGVTAIPPSFDGHDDDDPMA